MIRNSDIDVITGLPGSAYTSFGTEPVGPHDLLLKYTYIGDGNLDGLVSFDDYVGTDNAFFGLIPNLGWATGDINFDNAINFDDYTVVDQAFFFQAAPLAVGQAPPAAAHAVGWAEFDEAHALALDEPEASAPRPLSRAKLSPVPPVRSPLPASTTVSKLKPFRYLLLPALYLLTSRAPPTAHPLATSGTRHCSPCSDSSVALCADPHCHSPMASRPLIFVL